MKYKTRVVKVTPLTMGARREAVCVHPHSSYKNTDCCEKYTSKFLKKHDLNAMPKDCSFVVASTAPNDTLHKSDPQAGLQDLKIG